MGRVTVLDFAVVVGEREDTGSRIVANERIEISG
jgi:hypothetical protein